MNIKRKNIELAILFGLIFSVLLSMSRFDAACEDLRGSVLRLHIIANSNSAADQELKLKVRDEILRQTGDIFDGAKSLDEAVRAANASLKKIKAAAEKQVELNGADYKVSVEIADSYFENREYEDFTLPAGVYRSLIVRLGEAEGKNWWCVIFPSVCIPSAAEHSLSEAAGQYSTKIAETPQKYVIRFKSIEWYEGLKRFLRNKS